ncbi:MAG: hypothetical protein WCK05_12860 [Planctomycetota bacterium]
MTTLLEQITARTETDRGKTQTLYRELLARNATPQKGDAEDLRKIMAELDKTPAQVQADLDILARAAALEIEAGKVTTLTVEAEAADTKAADAQRAVNDALRGLQEKANAANLEAERVGVVLERAKRSARELRELRQANSALFGLPEEPVAVGFHSNIQNRPGLPDRE